jgi:hypothetical protein
LATGRRPALVPAASPDLTIRGICSIRYNFL